MPLLNLGKFSQDNPLRSWLTRYINLTGSHQYWDFFAPTIPKFHQYLSICRDVVSSPQQGKIDCRSTPLFTNLDFNFSGLDFFSANNSRLYRLTENLTAFNDPTLLQAFARYYLVQSLHQTGPSPVLVLHVFELAPGFEGLPSYGYRMDKLLLLDTR